ncbi:hypothetical protein D9M68_719440 [compost metagenome]
MLAFRGGQYFIDIGRGYAVGHQRPLHVDLRTFAHGALAHDLGGVEEVVEAGRLGATDGGFVVGEHHRPDNISDGAFAGQGLGDEILQGGGTIVAWRQDVARDGFQQTFGAGAFEVDHLDVDHIPLDIAGLDLGLHFRHAAGVVLEQHLDPGIFLVGVDNVFFLRRAVGATPGHHGQAVLRSGGEGCRSQRCSQGECGKACRQ